MAIDPKLSKALDDAAEDIERFVELSFRQIFGDIDACPQKPVRPSGLGDDLSFKPVTEDEPGERSAALEAALSELEELRIETTQLAAALGETEANLDRVKRERDAAATKLKRVESDLIAVKAELAATRTAERLARAEAEGLRQSLRGDAARAELAAIRDRLDELLGRPSPADFRAP